MLKFMTVAILAASMGQAESPAGDADGLVPAQLCRGFWMMPVELEPGPSGVLHTLWFLHDTGASQTFVDPDALARVSGRAVESGQRVTITDARSGALSINRLPARVRDLDHLSIALGRPIDGIMSVHALEGLLLTLDYPAGQMRVTRGALPRPDGRTVFSTRGPDRRPWLRVDLAGRTRPLLIDSGAGGLSFAVNDIERFDLLDPPRLLSSAVRFDRIERRRLARLNGDALVAGMRVEMPVLEEVPRAELLGAQILRHFVLTLDQANRRVRLERSGSGAISAADHVEFGAGLRPKAQGLEVFEVFEATPFAAAGVLAGEVITHMDGVPVAERGCVDHSAQRGAVTLTLRRDEVEREVDVDLFAVLAAP